MRFKNSIKVSPLLYVYAKYLVNIMLYIICTFFYFDDKNICLRDNHKAVTINVSKVIPITKNIRLGPAGFTGTEALCKVVNAGVFSCSFARMASNCVQMAE